ncbi:MAG TPA: hypothetical protein VN281_10545 [Verrucomicrobiae bacterium]|nr:hypothetical protein [Verrucomicrobiae bacterium]
MNRIYLRTFCQSALAIGAFCVVAAVMSARASSSIVTFSVDMATNVANGTFNPGGGDLVKVRGTFDNWGGGVFLSQQGSGTVYTNTVNNTHDQNGFPMPYVFLIEHTVPSTNDSYEGVADFNNRCAYMPATSGGSLVLGTPIFGDAGGPGSMTVNFQVDMSEQVFLGNFDANSGATVEVHGEFNGWGSGLLILTNNPSIVVTNQGGVLTSNVYQGSLVLSNGAAASPFATSDYKYVIQPGTKYEGVSAANSDGGGNRFFIFTDGTSLNLPTVLYNDAPFAPTVQVGFSVDMTAVVLSDTNFEPSTVQVDGSFNGWASPVYCTNNPGAANTNVYSAVIGIGEGTQVFYQFRYLSAGSTIYDHETNGQNRAYTIPSIPTTNLPTPYFNNTLPTDLLNQDTTVTFSVNMLGAMGTDGTVYDPNSTTVFINGDFIGWQSWNPVALASYQMTNNPPPTNIYYYAYLFPKGHARLVNYKYSMNGTDNEAGANQNHIRYIRSTNGTYNMPLDTFGNQHIEPKIGGLMIGAASGGQIPISWLPYPTALLQSRADLKSGSWQDIPATQGGGNTNWPATGSKMFFRLKGQ